MNSHIGRGCRSCLVFSSIDLFLDSALVTDETHKIFRNADFLVFLKRSTPVTFSDDVNSVLSLFKKHEKGLTLT